MNFYFNGGRGLVKISGNGTFDVHYKHFNEHLSITKPVVLAKNIIFGRLYIDFDGTMECHNHSTGERAFIKLIQKQGT